jgi:hypothetical protein
MTQRGLGVKAIEVQKIEEAIDRQIKKALMEHPLWSWLSQYPGLGGVQTARLIAIIDDPRRFPGQMCSGSMIEERGRAVRKVHYHPPIHEVGAPCPHEGADRTCDGMMLPPREGTGVRSVWHFCGLHVDDDGRSPRKKKGQRADWNPEARTCVLMPGGIADSIVRLRVPKYRDIYEVQKDRLTRERGAGEFAVIEGSGGPADIRNESDVVGGGVGGPSVIDQVTGLAPFKIDALARKIAAKAFVGDLLMEWKKVVA